MSKFFSFKLYRQGLRKSRVAGVTATIIVSVLSILPPIIHLFSPVTTSYSVLTSVIEQDDLNSPLTPILFLAPILTLNMFSYLNHRNESDFYHTIPFTRPCTFFSFMASILTWMAFAIAMGLSLASILYAVDPYAEIVLLDTLKLFGLYLLAVAMLSAMTALAMTVTGTLITNLLLFALIVSFVRIIGFIFLNCTSTIIPIWSQSDGLTTFLHPLYNLPLALLFGWYPGWTFANISLCIYTAVVTLLLLAAGCFLYSIRRSEMAGKSAPSRLMQHIYRCAITLPLACILAASIISDLSSDGTLDLISVHISSLTTILLCYYLYEIITTKRLKNCLSATPFLTVLLAGGLLFTGGVYLTRGVVLNYTPDAAQIKTVTIPGLDIQTNYQSFEKEAIRKVALDDPIVRELIAAKLQEAKTVIQKQGIEAYETPVRIPIYNKYGEIEGYESNHRLTVQIVGKGGMTRGRYLIFTESEYQTLRTALVQSNEYMEAVLSIPTKKMIDSYKYGYGWERLPDEYSKPTPGRAEALWESLAEEYNTFSDEQKLSYKNRLTEGIKGTTPYISVQGELDGTFFGVSYYILPEYFPKTYTRWAECFNEDWGSEIDSQIDQLESKRPYQVIVLIGEPSYRLTQTNSVMQCYEYLEAHKQSEFQSSFVRVTFSIDANEFEQHRIYFLTEEDALELADLLIDRYF